MSIYTSEDYSNFDHIFWNVYLVPDWTSWQEIMELQTGKSVE